MLKAPDGSLLPPAKCVRKYIEPNSLEKASAQRVGIEIERIGIWPDGHALRYRRDAATQRPGAEDLMRLLENSYDWEPLLGTDGARIGFKTVEGKVSLEPGSQLEFSAEPVANLVELKKIVCEYEQKIEAVTKPWGLRWVGLGINPVDTVDSMDVIPLSRYAIMTEYLGARGKLATSMMRLTTSIQLNFDYRDEAEAIEMLRTALVLAPLSYAMFGNSAIAGGKETGFLSYRTEIWNHTDTARSGLLPEAFAPGFDLDAYARLVSARPLMFAENEQGDFVPAHGRSLDDIAQGKLPGVTANDANAVHAIRELFTEARLKMGYIEVRSIDGLPHALRFAATAFWTGVLYCPQARREVLERFGSLSAADRDRLWDEAGKVGLNAKFEDGTLLESARHFAERAKDCLARRDRGEEALFAPLEKILNENKNPAQAALEQWRGTWNRDPQKLIDFAAKP